MTVNPVMLMPKKDELDSEEDRRRKQIAIVRLRLIRESSFKSLGVVESPTDAHEVFQEFLGVDSDREICALLCLDTKNRPTAMQVVSIGTLSSTLIQPREIFKTAILANAASIICAHWHPSRDPEPSPEDVKITYRLMQAGELMGIKLLDHLILGEDEHYLSMKESGIMESLCAIRSTGIDRNFAELKLN